LFRREDKDMNYPKRAAIADLVAPATALGMMGRPPARLVIEGECTTCRPICDDTENGISIVLIALAHSTATKHVVILNGTTDVPYGD
jgi:hypothetical protein